MSTEPAVVILAGGEGTRLGGGKPFRMFAGERLIDRALRNARRWSDVVVVAVRNDKDFTNIGADLIRDRPDIEGPLGGLISGLQYARAQGREFLLTVPSDMPFLPAGLSDRLRSGIGNRACAIAASGGHAHPVCALWRTAALDQLDSYMAGKGRSLKGFAALAGFREVEWTVDPLDPFFNINTPDDLAFAERLAVT